MYPPCVPLPCPETTSPIGADRSSLLGLRTEDRKGQNQVKVQSLQLVRKKNKSNRATAGVTLTLVLHSIVKNVIQLLECVNVLISYEACMLPMTVTQLYHLHAEI